MKDFMWKTIQIAFRKNGVIQTLLDRAEVPMIIILHMGILFTLLGIAWGDPIISFSTVFLAIMYLMAISLNIPQKDATRWSQILFKASYLGCAISLLGIFSKSYFFTIYRPLLITGSVLLVLILMNVLIRFYKNPHIRIFDRRAYIRNLAIIIVGIIYVVIA